MKKKKNDRWSHPRNTNPSPKQLQATRDNSDYGQLCMTIKCLERVLTNPSIHGDEEFDLNASLSRLNYIKKEWLTRRQAYRDQM